jgi:hypothetical protein
MVTKAVQQFLGSLKIGYQPFRLGAMFRRGYIEEFASQLVRPDVGTAPVSCPSSLRVLRLMKCSRVQAGQVIASYSVSGAFSSSSSKQCPTLMLVFGQVKTNGAIRVRRNLVAKVEGTAALSTAQDGAAAPSHWNRFRIVARPK